MFGYVVCMSRMKAGNPVLYLKYLLQSNLFTYADDPGVRVCVKATEGVRKPPEAAHPTQQNMANAV